eukprot:scaffold72574_cov67-Phaeocystis_antarctica.AAC.7
MQASGDGPNRTFSRPFPLLVLPDVFPRQCPLKRFISTLARFVAGKREYCEPIEAQAEHVALQVASEVNRAAMARTRGRLGPTRRRGWARSRRRQNEQWTGESEKRTDLNVRLQRPTQQARLALGGRAAHEHAAQLVHSRLGARPLLVTRRRSQLLRRLRRGHDLGLRAEEAVAPQPVFPGVEQAAHHAHRRGPLAPLALPLTVAVAPLRLCLLQRIFGRPVLVEDEQHGLLEDGGR